MDTEQTSSQNTLENVLSAKRELDPVSTALKSSTTAKKLMLILNASPGHKHCTIDYLLALRILHHVMNCSGCSDTLHEGAKELDRIWLSLAPQIGYLNG